MQRLIGLETEYGIWVEGSTPYDQTKDAAELVRSYPGKCHVGWDYRVENPRRDARGFVAARLRVDPMDAKYETPSAAPPEELRSDRVLENGARLYNDHGHPEYSTPECLSLIDLVAHDRAGERVVFECARAYSERTGRAVRLYKNNIDYQGASYGTHENYLALRSVPFERYAKALLTFLPTRVIFAGSGKVHMRGDGPSCFSLSQRAEVFAETMGIDTLYRRPLVNTRDEPHADETLWRRLHVIAGDANMNTYATALKIGTTCLLLDLVEDGWDCPVQLADPIRAITHISSDETYRWIVELADGRKMGALEIQRVFLKESIERFSGRDPQTDWVIQAWESVLDGLERDPSQLADRLDWPAKLQVLRTFMDEERVEWGSDRLVAADLEYHNLDPEEGLFWVLDVVSLVSDERVREACQSPPRDTRAAVRGIAVSNFCEDVAELSWGGLSMRTTDGSCRVDLSNVVKRIESEFGDALATASSTDEFVRIALGSK